MIKAIAIDDEPLALDIIKAYSSEIAYLHLSKTFTKPSEAKAYLEQHECDLIFLDIHMPDITGIDFLRRIKRTQMIIFTTAYSHYAAEGFQLNAIDYLLKPIERERFQQAAEKAKEYNTYIRRKNSDEFMYVYEEYFLVKIAVKDILYIQAMDDYIKIFLAHAKPVMTLGSLKAMLDKLPAGMFVRVHRSYIVALAHIQSKRSKTIFINDTEIPVGSSYIKSVEQQLRAN